MDISAGRISDTDVTVLLYAMIGIFQNRFSFLWAPTSECLSVLISKHVGTSWENFMRYFGEWQTAFLSSHNCPKEVNDNSSEKSNGKSSTLLFICLYHNIFKFAMVRNKSLMIIFPFMMHFIYLLNKLKISQSW